MTNTIFYIHNASLESACKVTFWLSHEPLLLHLNFTSHDWILHPPNTSIARVCYYIFAPVSDYSISYYRMLYISYLGKWTLIQVGHYKNMTSVKQIKIVILLEVCSRQEQSVVIRSLGSDNENSWENEEAVWRRKSVPSADIRVAQWSRGLNLPYASSDRDSRLTASQKLK